MKPKSRTENLIIEESDEGIVIYDLERETIHALNTTAAMVFKACDGRTDIHTMASRLPSALELLAKIDIVHTTLTKLDGAHLLYCVVPTRQVRRRALLKSIISAGLSGAILPVVTTITAPPPAAAGSAKFCVQCSKYDCPQGVQQHGCDRFNAYAVCYVCEPIELQGCQVIHSIPTNLSTACDPLGVLCIDCCSAFP